MRRDKRGQATLGTQNLRVEARLRKSHSIVAGQQRVPRPADDFPACFGDAARPLWMAHKIKKKTPDCQPWEAGGFLGIQAVTFTASIGSI